IFIGKVFHQSKNDLVGRIPIKLSLRHDSGSPSSAYMPASIAQPKQQQARQANFSNAVSIESDS
ncbi:MAG: hypothetical protein J4G18_05940, partial [Anaerolineae bacterium]|nr:hypothetical protein [Anaerolineae bacterium]